MKRLYSLLTVPLLAVACAGPASFTGRTEAELRGSFGAPAAEYAHADGSRTLAFTTGRFGTQTFMAEVAPGGTIRAVRQALNDDTFHQVTHGMTREAVLQLIGPPGDSTAFPNLAQTSWEYHFMDTWGYRAYFYVNFDANGIVVSKLTRRIDRDPAGNR